MHDTLIKLASSEVGENEISILDGAVVIPKRYLRERVRLEEGSILIVSGTLIEELVPRTLI